MWQAVKTLWNRMRHRKLDLVAFPEIFEHFQDLLQDHQRVMELIADLGEKSGGEYIFDRKYLIDTSEEIQTLLLRMVKGLNLITSNRYLDLFQAIDRIFIPLGAELRGRLILSKEMPLVIPLEAAPQDRPELIGGKAAHLAAAIQNLHLPVPPGFVITSRAYRLFLEHNHLEARIHALLEDWVAGELDEHQASRQIQYSVLAGVVPHEVAAEIKRQAEKGGPWAVRSSAYGEDGELSFAGLHESQLQVPVRNILTAYKKVLASLYSPEALIYRQKMGMLGEEAAMAVLCQEQIPSLASGVVHTLDVCSQEPNDIVIFASWGLGRTVVEGKDPVDRYVVERGEPYRVLTREIARKESQCRGLAGGGEEEVPVPEEDRDRETLPESAIQTLVRLSQSLERYFKRPQEIEWAMDPEGDCWILQSRALQPSRTSVPIPQEIYEICALYPVLMRGIGVVAQAGVGAGLVVQISSDADMEKFPEGAVLVTKYAAPWLARIVPKAAAIVVETGSLAGHLATIAREFRVPTLLGVEGATEILKDSLEVTADTRQRVIYAGRAKELLQFELVQPPPYQDISRTCALYPVLTRGTGVVAHAGVGAGTVAQISSDADMEKFPDGAVLVTKYTAPWLARIVPKAAALVAERGSAAGHLATIAREFRVPTLVGVEEAMEILKEGLEVTVDTKQRIIYAGRVNELLRYELFQSLAFEDAPEFRLLRRILARIAPLHLIDPQDPNFTPEGCQSVHDVIRFIHEKAVEELLDLPRFVKRFKGVRIFTLVSDIPLGLKVLDLGGGIAPEAQGTKLLPEHIRSLPMKALWQGLSGPGVWSTEPVPVDFQGMMSSISKTAVATNVSGFNLAVISDTYMNLHLRLGYHFNLVDARMESDPPRNHIYFRFVGGVTDLTRRSRRAQLLQKILSQFHFKVDTKGDLVVAKVLHLPREDMEQRLQVLGRLVGFTRQLDIQLRSDEDVPEFVEAFFDQNSRLREQPPEGGEHDGT